MYNSLGSSKMGVGIQHETAHFGMTGTGITCSQQLYLANFDLNTGISLLYIGGFLYP